MRFVAVLVNTTKRPSAEIAAPQLEPSAGTGCPPSVPTLTRSKPGSQFATARPSDAQRSRTSTFHVPRSVLSTRFEAALMKTTNRPSGEKAEPMLSPSPPTPTASSLIRRVRGGTALPSGVRANTSPSESARLR